MSFSCEHAGKLIAIGYYSHAAFVFVHINFFAPDADFFDSRQLPRNAI
jgi:hypothetical protein